MKDYTKYDFSAIVGAEVTIEIKGETIKGILRSYVHDKGVGGINGTLWIENEAGFMHSTHEAFILSLSAKIKVEDMSLKQMMEFCFHKGNCNYVVLYNDKTCVSTCGKHAKNIELKDYIDCTDWGWKHE